MSSRIQGTEGMVNSVSFSPDGTRLVSGSDDTNVHVWDALSGTEIMPPLQGHNKPVASAAYSSDGSHIISTSHGSVCVWDAITGLLCVSDVAHHKICHVPHEPTPLTMKICGDQWLVDASTNQIFSKLPNIIIPRCSATFGRSLAIGTESGQVFILNFPAAFFPIQDSGASAS
jgi:WD40 repeat protein